MLDYEEDTVFVRSIKEMGRFCKSCTASSNLETQKKLGQLK